MTTFTEHRLYGERRRTDRPLDMALIFPGLYQILDEPYISECDTRRHSIEVYLVQDPTAVIAVKRESNILDGFTTIHMKIVSTHPDVFVSKIKFMAPYLQDDNPPPSPIVTN